MGIKDKFVPIKLFNKCIEKKKTLNIYFWR